MTYVIKMDGIGTVVVYAVNLVFIVDVVVVAIQVSGDPGAGNNGLFYLHSDHLGSANALSYGWQTDGTPHPSQGQRVGELTRFYPFGEYRTGGQSQITDLGFTGHKENRGLGLTYMNARFYLLGVGRFVTADTIVPDPANPQSYNRYSYTYNNPLIYIDPTGHCIQMEMNQDGLCLHETITEETVYRITAAILLIIYAPQKPQHIVSSKAAPFLQTVQKN